MIELTDVDRWASAASVQESADYFPSDPRTINGQMPASSSRSPQRTVFSEPPPISPSAGANGSQNIIPIQRMASNLGTQAGSLLHEMDPFSSGDAAPANPAVPHPSVSIFEPPISIPLNDASTLVYSTCHPFTWEDAHVSSSSLGPMAQHGYYNFGSLDKAIMNDSACDETILSSYYPVSDNCLPPSQPTCSVNPRVYSGMPVNNPVGGHSAFSASNRSLSHVRSTGLQATSSSSQVAQTTQDYVPTFGDNADVQDTFFLPEMNHRNLPRSYDFQGEPRGLSQGEVYRKSQRSRHASSGLSPTYASTGHNHFPNAIATSSISRLEPRHPFL
ncbi:hypothetical protein C0992_003571 [Termitomyces sp. T32_za158]|nr:hypothetical protein C0992_003571 [Termitomyces sp. T32_za158]